MSSVKINSSKLSVILPIRQIVSETLDHNKDPELSISDLPQKDELAQSVIRNGLFSE